MSSIFSPLLLHLCFSTLDYYIKKPNPPVEDLCFWGFYPSGMQKNLCNWPLWKRLEPPLEVHFCFLTPLERAFFFHFSQLPLWKKWLISPLENEVLDRGVRVLNVIAHSSPRGKKIKIRKCPAVHRDLGTVRCKSTNSELFKNDRGPGYL